MSATDKLTRVMPVGYHADLDGSEWPYDAGEVDRLVKRLEATIERLKKSSEKCRHDIRYEEELDHIQRKWSRIKKA
jgi:hypothetical protein